MLRCNEVTRLYASDELSSSPWPKRLAVRLHLMMCRSCERYVRELGALGKAARTAYGDPELDEARMDELARRIVPRAPDQEPKP